MLKVVEVHHQLYPPFCLLKKSQTLYRHALIKQPGSYLMSRDIL